MAFFHRFGELFVEVDGVFGTLLELIIFDLCHDILGHECFVLRSSVCVDLQRLQLSVAIRGKSDTLFFLPNLNETLDCCQSELLLLDSQLTVLAHSVKADYVLLVLSPELVELNDGPLFLLGLPLGTLCLSGLLGLLLSFVKCLDLSLLLLQLLRVVLPVGDSFG